MNNLADILRIYALCALIGFCVITWVHEARTDEITSFSTQLISPYVGGLRPSGQVPLPSLIVPSAGVSTEGQ